MSKADRSEAICRQLESMTNDAQTMNLLLKQKRDVAAKLAEKNTEIDHSLSIDVTKKREEERLKRLKKNSNVEQRLQQVTSALMLELMEICSQEEVPRYIVAIAKILDNYQGNFIIHNHNLHLLTAFTNAPSVTFYYLAN